MNLPVFNNINICACLLLFLIYQRVFNLDRFMIYERVVILFLCIEQRLKTLFIQTLGSGQIIVDFSKRAV